MPPRVIFNRDIGFLNSFYLKAFIFTVTRFLQIVLLEEGTMTSKDLTNKKIRLSTVDLALTAVFTALWAVLNLTLGPLSFQLLGLPLLHDFGVFFTLLLVTWITGRFGTSIVAGIIGSAIAILMGGPVLTVGFAAGAIVFDLLMFANKHKIRISLYSLAIAAIATIASAYFAGVIIGTFFMGNGILWALTIWGGWHLIGGILTVAAILPIIVVLEKANLRKIKN
jgi:hypothetical protein